MRPRRRNADSASRGRERRGQTVDESVIDKLRTGRPGNITLYELANVTSGLIPPEVAAPIHGHALRAVARGSETAQVGIEAWAVYTRTGYADDWTADSLASTHLTLEGAQLAAIESIMDYADHDERAELHDYLATDPDFVDFLNAARHVAGLIVRVQHGFVFR